jgi:hypothetical protein
MEEEPRILIGDRVVSRRDLFQEEEKARKERAKLSFEEKIRIFVRLQELAYNWGRKKEVIIWKI